MMKHEWSEPDWRELMLVLMLIIVIEIGRRRSESRDGKQKLKTERLNGAVTRNAATSTISLIVI